MGSAAERQRKLEALRPLVEGHGPRARREVSRDPRRLPSGIEALDAHLGGGLAAGEMLHLEAAPGGGALTLTALWVRHAAAQGASCLVVDAAASTLPHAWVPASKEGAIWVVTPAHPSEAWVATDLALRSGAFELVVTMDAPTRPDVAPRLRRLLRDHGSRLLLLGAPPFRVPRRARVSLTDVRWSCAAVGDAPAARTLSIDTGSGRGGELLRDDIHTDRLRPHPRAPDRRTSRRSRSR